MREAEGQVKTHLAEVVYSSGCHREAYAFVNAAVDAIMTLHAMLPMLNAGRRSHAPCISTELAPSPLAAGESCIGRAEPGVFTAYSNITASHDYHKLTWAFRLSYSMLPIAKTLRCLAALSDHKRLARARVFNSLFTTMTKPYCRPYSSRTRGGGLDTDITTCVCLCFAGRQGSLGDRARRLGPCLPARDWPRAASITRSEARGWRSMLPSHLRGN